MPGSVLKTLHIDLIGVGRCCFMKVEAGSGREHTDQPKSHSWSVLALRLESSVSDSGTPAFSVTGLRHCPGTASGLSLGRTAELGTSSPPPRLPAPAPGLSWSGPAGFGLGPAAAAPAEALHYFKPGPAGPGWAQGVWPRTSFLEVTMASLLSPEQLSEAVTSQQTGRRPSGLQTSSPGFLLLPYPPVFSATLGSPPAPHPHQCPLLAESAGVGRGSGLLLLGLLQFTPHTSKVSLAKGPFAPWPQPDFSPTFPLRQATRSQKEEQRYLQTWSHSRTLEKERERRKQTSWDLPRERRRRKR